MLKELQLVADSSDSLKRNRGRRGLDILQKIQKMSGVDVMISDIDFPEVREVDLKLIELARTLQGKIVTNDFNLNKVAQLRGVEVLNINELANSLKPVVLPGEFMKVFILKEGKEYNQGVAYLDDGTMVVVDNARKMISKTIDIVVTSVLQTTAGKMIFGRYIESAGAARQPVVGRPQCRRRPVRCRAGGEVAGRADSPIPLARLPPFHWWRTVFFLIPAISLYTIVLGTARCCRRCSIATGDFGHRCARAWAWLILKTTGVHVRVRRPRAPRSRSQLRLRLESPEHLRHPDRVRVAAVPAADHRQGFARSNSRFSAGTCAGPATCSSTGENPGAGILKTDGAPRQRRPLAHRLSRGHAKRGRRGRAVQGRHVPARDRCGAAGGAGQYRRQPVRHAERPADGLPRTTSRSPCIHRCRRRV